MTYLSASLSVLWLAAFWMLTRDRLDNHRLTLAGIGASILAVLIAVTHVQQATLAGYPTDSFWTLSLIGRTGVIAISAIGITLIFYGLAWKTAILLRLKSQVSATAWVIFDLAAGWLVFGVIYSVSPQIFYTFYRMIFDYLPNQWVIDTALDTEKLHMIAQLSASGNMSDHMAGVALWAILPFTAWLHLRDWWRG